MKEEDSCMCDFSRESFTRPMQVGETTRFGTVRTYGGSSIVAPLPIAGVGRVGVACLCLPHNTVHRLTDIPECVQKSAGITTSTADVVFLQGSVTAQKDRFLFLASGQEVELGPWFEGVGIVCVANNMEEYLANQKRSEALQTANAGPDPEGELVDVLVPVGVSAVTAAATEAPPQLSLRGHHRGSNRQLVVGITGTALAIVLMAASYVI